MIWRTSSRVIATGIFVLKNLPFFTPDRLEPIRVHHWKWWFYGLINSDYNGFGGICITMWIYIEYFQGHSWVRFCFTFRSILFNLLILYAFCINKIMVDISKRYEKRAWLSVQKASSPKFVIIRINSCSYPVSLSCIGVNWGKLATD